MSAELNFIAFYKLPKVGCTNWKRTMLQLIHPDTFGRLDINHIKGPHGHYGEEGYKYITVRFELSGNRILI